MKIENDNTELVILVFIQNKKSSIRALFDKQVSMIAT